LSLAENLKTLLTRKNISVTELARQTRLPQPVIHRLVNGNTPNPTVFTLSSIAKFFSITINQLMEGNFNSHKIINDITDNTINNNVNILNSLVEWKMLNKLIKPKSKIHDGLYMLSMKDYKYEITDPVFSKNTVITVNLNLSPVDNDYVLICKKSSAYPYIAQYINDKKDIFIKPLNQHFNARHLLKDEKIIGTIINASTDFLKNRIEK
jgi:transcriptional regulator with XRE-family HTH domain